MPTQEYFTHGEVLALLKVDTKTLKSRSDSLGIEWKTDERDRRFKKIRLGDLQRLAENLGIVLSLPDTPIKKEEADPLTVLTARVERLTDQVERMLVSWQEERRLLEAQFEALRRENQDLSLQLERVKQENTTLKRQLSLEATSDEPAE